MVQWHLLEAKFAGSFQDIYSKMGWNNTFVKWLSRLSKGLWVKRSQSHGHFSQDASVHLSRLSHWHHSHPWHDVRAAVDPKWRRVWWVGRNAGKRDDLLWTSEEIDIHPVHDRPTEIQLMYREIFQGICSTNERRRYTVTSSLSLAESISRKTPL